MDCIDGVVVKNLRKIDDERGWLMEMLRCDDEIFQKFGQVYMTAALPGVIKAWHYHRIQTDHFVPVKGDMKIALYDPREGSPTRGKVMEFIPDYNKPILIKIPPYVYHGFMATGNDVAYLLNVPTEPYNYKNPDEYRVPADSPDVPYKW